MLNLFLGSLYIKTTYNWLWVGYFLYGYHSSHTTAQEKKTHKNAEKTHTTFPVHPDLTNQKKKSNE